MVKSKHSLESPCTEKVDTKLRRSLLHTSRRPCWPGAREFTRTRLKTEQKPVRSIQAIFEPETKVVTEIFCAKAGA